MEAEAISVKVDRATLKTLADLVEKQTGYRPSHKELIDKAMAHDIEKLQNFAESSPKKAKVG